MTAETTVDDDGVEYGEVRYFQNHEGRLPLNQVDTDARWKTTRTRQAPGLQYQENVIVDRAGAGGPGPPLRGGKTRPALSNVGGPFLKTGRDILGCRVVGRVGVAFDERVWDAQCLELGQYPA